MCLTMLGWSLQSCEKVTDLVQSIDQNQSQLSSPAQDNKAKKLYLALQSYDSQKLKPLLSQSLRQQIEHEPTAIIDVFKLIPEGQANFGKLDQAHYSQREDIGDMTTQVYTFEHVDSTLALTIVFKGRSGGDEVIAFTLDQIQSDQKKLQLGQAAQLDADAIAMPGSNMSAGSDMQEAKIQDKNAPSGASTGQAIASAAIDDLLTRSRAMTGNIETDQTFLDLGRAVQASTQAKDLMTKPSLSQDSLTQEKMPQENMSKEKTSHQSVLDQAAILKSTSVKMKRSDTEATEQAEAKKNIDYKMNEIIAEVAEVSELKQLPESNDVKGDTSFKETIEDKKAGVARERVEAKAHESSIAQPQASKLSLTDIDAELNQLKK